MPKIRIEGNQKLSGTIKVSGAKNSAVALIPASILCDEEVVINNVPNISDIDDLESILQYLNVDVKRTKESVIINGTKMENKNITPELSCKLRASYYFMGALLGKYKKVDISFPGGCAIGARPIDLHLKGFTKLGAKIVEDDNHFHLEAKELKGARIYLDVPSVGATINIMLAAVKARGVTKIENAAMEPEIVNVATFLTSMGAKISGAGTSLIKIRGVKKLHNSFHEVIPDRIEAGTFLVIAALLGHDLTISKVIPSHLESLTSKLAEAGVDMDIGVDYIRIKDVGEYNSVNIKTMVYPGYPTDLQQIIIPFLTKCQGASRVEETIYENRFLNIADTIKMGANIDIVAEDTLIVNGPTKLYGKEVKATDLRGGASMIICGLIAEGITFIDNIEYILRGYEDICGKLKEVGAKIELI